MTEEIKTATEQQNKKPLTEAEKARIETELSLARKIQERSLPSLKSLGEHPEFDLAAFIQPETEIGGDFYDFIQLDSSHLALMIADVSGKGIPSALYMMVAKMTLDNALRMPDNFNDPAAVLAYANKDLCRQNLEDMFVSVWLGILDLETGHILSANAGHEYPAVSREGGGFEISEGRHDLVLGCVSDAVYMTTDFDLFPGDTIFIYTDGITKANNSQKEFFGKDRMLKALDKTGTEDIERLVTDMKKEIEEFAGEEPQSDDISMMALKLNSLHEPEGFVAEPPTEESIGEMEEYLEDQMDLAGVNHKDLMKMNICIDELYANIVRYSKATRASGVLNVDDVTVSITFKDNGTPYDPTAKEDPDITVPVDEREEEGGLGIYLSKKMLDELTYKYEGGWNILTLTLYRDKK